MCRIHRILFHKLKFIKKIDFFIICNHNSYYINYYLNTMIADTFTDGVYTVLVTPFTDDDTIDYNSIEKWLDMQYDVQSNIVGLVLLGTTSESPTLTNCEKVEIVKYVHTYNSNKQNKKKLIIGVGGNFTKEVVEFTEQIEKYADGIMVTVPHYNKPPQRGIAEHFKFIANKFPTVPIMMYNVPGRTCVNMEPETMIDIIMSCSNVVALKEANGNLKTTAKFIELITKSSNRVLGSSFKIFSGDDANIVHHCKMGASGVISIASNIIPQQISDIVSLCLSSQFDLATKKLEKIIGFIGYLFVETNPIPIKEIMYLSHIYKTNNMRLPLVKMDKEKSEILHEMYSNL